jgi:hypothetical protein
MAVGSSRGGVSCRQRRTNGTAGVAAIVLKQVQEVESSTFSLASRCASPDRVAKTLVETYLGQNAGRHLVNVTCEQISIDKGGAGSHARVLPNSECKWHELVSPRLSPFRR